MAVNVNVILDLDFPNKASSKYDLFKEMAPVLSQSVVENVGSETIEKALKEREDQGTTGFGNGLAIPHGKVEGINTSYLFFIRLRNEIDWKSLDEDLVKHIFIILVSKDDRTNEHLKILSKLAYNLIVDSYQQQIKEETDPNLLRLLIEEMFNKKEEE